MGFAFVLTGALLSVWAGVSGWHRENAPAGSGPTALAAPTPQWRGEPIVPTAYPTSRAKTVKHTELTRTPPSVPLVGAKPAALLEPGERFGLGVPYPPLAAETARELGLGWYLAWRVIEQPAALDGVEFWQMIRVREDGYRPDQAAIRRAALANPGATWIIGNEPDVIWQDNITPERYAVWYHELYHFLKAVDPSCRVAIGGITQPTPLRLAYLDRVLLSYWVQYGREMPVEVWNIHNFILPEKRDGWGVDIPPGLHVDQGRLYELDDHDDLEIFQTHLIEFRRWMAERGQRRKPLVVSEYGILMPEDYGFGPERVQRFMKDSYDLMLTAADEETGYPADGNRLVQRWAWFSLGDRDYATGNLTEPETGQLTELGKIHQTYLSGLSQ